MFSSRVPNCLISSSTEIFCLSFRAQKLWQSWLLLTPFSYLFQQTSPKLLFWNKQQIYRTQNIKILRNLKKTLNLSYNFTFNVLWSPTHGRAKAGWPAWTYIQQLCEDTGCCPKDLPEAMNDRKKWRERVRDIRATSTTSWWWWYLC